MTLYILRYQQTHLATACCLLKAVSLSLVLAKVNVPLHFIPMYRKYVSSSHILYVNSFHVSITLLTFLLLSQSSLSFSSSPPPPHTLTHFSPESPSLLFSSFVHSVCLISPSPAAVSFPQYTCTFPYFNHLFQGQSPPPVWHRVH